MNLLSNSCQQTGKKSEKRKKSGPLTNPVYRASAKISFIIVIQPFHWCRQNARKKYHRYCVG